VSEPPEPKPRPTILAVDDEREVVRAVQRDLRARYGQRGYRVLTAASGEEALRLVDEVVLRGDPLPVVVSDQRMPGMDGVTLLEEVRRRAPDAGLVLLTAYADTDAAIRGINAVKLDQYLQKPWDPPDTKLYPTVDDLLTRYEIEAASGGGGSAPVRVIGHRWSRDSYAIKDLLVRSMRSYRWIDVETDPDAAALLAAAGGDADHLPVVVLADGEVMLQPTVAEVGARLGLNGAAGGEEVHDLVIVGAGPAGLAAAVYGASEGLSTVLVDREGPGGQAAQSSRIENYLGFPEGLSGADLAARAKAQVDRFAARVVSLREAVALEAEGLRRAVALSDGSRLVAQAVLIATGVSYRTLEAEGAERLAGLGVYYGAARAEAELCENEDVLVLGGGNSAGQATLFLADRARSVTLLHRRASLAETMSHYLVERIAVHSRVRVRGRVEVAAVHGEERLRAVTLGGPEGGDTLEATSLFVFIGAEPRTDWVGELVARDVRGFVLTGAEARAAGVGPPWPLERDPLPLETTLPGVFVAGDVRAGSVKRVASAVGEGAMAVQLLHDYLGLHAR
jgi:thioredoxin reductase (NADPH)